MKLFAGSKMVLRFGVIAVVACLCAGRAEPQNPNLKPSFGEVKLTAGFEPDPYVKNVVAGGTIATNLGGVQAFISSAPDFRLNYTAGNFALTFRAESTADTTLLILLPDGKKYIADDDSGGFPNPQIKLAKPESGIYDIWVGTVGKDTAPAKLIITELK